MLIISEKIDAIANYLAIFLLWFGFWSLCENILNIFVPYNSYIKRIIISIIVIVIALIILYIIY